MILSQRTTRYFSPELLDRHHVKRFEANVPYLVWHAVGAAWRPAPAATSDASAARFRAR